MNSKLLQSREILKMLIKSYQTPVAVLDMQGDFWLYNINMHKEVEAGNYLTFNDNKIQILDKSQSSDKLKNNELNRFLNNIKPNQDEGFIGKLNIDDNHCLNINVAEINKSNSKAFKVILISLAKDRIQSINEDHTQSTKDENTQSTRDENTQSNSTIMA